ncbi:PD-(D/E)XK motif protein [Bacteroides reticulotermitis]|uniref:PD-(D/E)XK motif protein n=2 Tax=Bacteroides reticulotermitis TaxID=1133319 RepID=W4UZR1_9BACE|nr:PD-(D/E)XK motif protein [Bacteroides reticulotermitis]MBB4046345.1 hypothetical protein [Bacteroides reticulotermitis]GAE86431.1 hypothetical protein JCM10512_4942 [Bacteroides reticulotermitis JCM 10512]GHV15011.1 hypothetical protein FACS1894169_05180 [Bacteroidia bacterium]GHV41912.1 hypothetical protein FACS1894179_10450 [Bacteroidia bacterium]
MKQSIYKTFARLQQKESVRKDVFLAATLPFTKKHKIGISSEGYPMFFIECTNTLHFSDINLEFISILFSRTCRLSESDSKQTENIYTIILLKTGNSDFQQYFIEIVCVVLEQLPESPSHEQLKKEIQKLIELFSRFNRPPRKTIQGLWAELFIIERAKVPEYLIQSWHTSPNDKFDFNDGYDKIEVKSTSTVRRMHSFSLEQLYPNQNSNLLVASVFVIQTGQGKNIFDLKDSICKRVQSLQLQFRLNDILSQTLGNDFDKVFDVYFDYQQALDTLAFYNFKNIPTISSDNIPEEINNIRFDCDLSHIISARSDEFISTESQLFKSIQI